MSARDELGRLARLAARGDLAAARRLEAILEKRNFDKEAAVLCALEALPAASRKRVAGWAAAKTRFPEDEVEEVIETLFGKRLVDARGRLIESSVLRYWKFQDRERVLFVEGGWAVALGTSGRSGWLSHPARGWDSWIQYDDGRIAYETLAAPVEIRKRLARIMADRLERGLK